MPQATFTLTMPESIWIGDVSQSYPDAVFRVLAAMPEESSGSGLVEIHHEGVAEILATIDAEEAVSSTEVMYQDEEQALLQFETETPVLLFAMQESGIPLQTPFEIVDGTVSWEITASQERLADLVDQFESFGIPFQVDRLQQQVDSAQLLTENQFSLVETALEAGYYDTPRDCTLVALAEDLDMAPSTVSETLHRAEERLIKEVMGSESAAESPANAG